MKFFSLYRGLRQRPHLLVAALIGAVIFLVLPDDWRSTTRILAAWDSAVASYILMVAQIMHASSPAKIRSQAARYDEGSLAILLLTTLGTFSSLAAIVGELATAKQLQGDLQLAHIALAGITVFLSWSFMQTIYALHYAHEYYQDDDKAMFSGLEFPGTAEPDYWDFAYFAFVIGTACQTADVNITSRTIRHIVGLHCVLAFFFNTTVLALTVNIGAGLF